MGNTAEVLQECGETLQHHNDKVQCVKWCPVEPMILLTGGFDRQVCTVDFARVGTVCLFSLSSSFVLAREVL